MSLTVLNVAWPFAPVGPDAIGGAEQIVHQLDVALVRAGHRSIVLAREGSTVAGELAAVQIPDGDRDDALLRDVWDRQLANLANVLAHASVDLVHLHGIDFHEYLPPPPVPVLVTLHLPPDWYPPEVFGLARPSTFLHCVSAAQERKCPPGSQLLPFIENGVPTKALAVRTVKGRYALALGRICPEKNFHVALDAGTRARIPVLLAGQVQPYEAHQRYFREKIVPRLGSTRRWLGPVGFTRKRRLMAAARCVLVPSLVSETSSLVAMEALACGTPVVAFRSGALPEIIEHGVTGYLVADELEMAEAIHLAGALDPEVCRETARRRFSLGRMVERYLDLYRRLAG